MLLRRTHRVYLGNATQRTAPKGLLWTERLILLSYFTALVIVTVDSTMQMRLGLSVLKHLPLISFVPSVILHFVGMTLFGNGTVRDGPIVKLLWPLLLLSAFAFIGSMCARMFFDVGDTFLTLGIYTLAPYIFARIILSSEHGLKLVRWHAILCIIAGLCISVTVFTGFGAGDTAHIHEYEWLVIPPMAFFFLMKPRRFWAIVLALVCVAAGALGKKNTSYLVLLLSLAYLGVWFLKSREGDKEVHLILRRAFVMFLTLAVVSVLTFVWIYREKYLPSGNLQYRLFQYTRALDEFFKSPLWGSAFTKGSGQEFTLWADPRYATMNLPTHNDILDLAKSGGLIALALWLYGIGRILIPAWSRAVAGAKLFNTPEMHFLILSSLSGILVYTFNPIILKPCFAFILWGNLGIIAGVLLRARMATEEEQEQ